MMRRPDLFDKVLSLSGLFQSDYFFHDYHDDLTYANSPLNFLQNMPLDHPYIRMYNESEIILCCGQGAWEEQMIDHMHRMQDVFARKGIEAWIDSGAMMSIMTGRGGGARSSIFCSFWCEEHLATERKKPEPDSFCLVPFFHEPS